MRNPMLRSAHWCFRALRECTDRDMVAELRFLAQSLLRQAREKRDAARARRAMLVLKRAA
jgi:hypothetical protein